MSKTHTHKCVIAITENGTGYLLKSNPNLFKFDTFDGDFLQDNVTEKKTIPKEFGVYTCNIMVKHIKYYTDCGWEHDCEIWIENVNAIDMGEMTFFLNYSSSEEKLKPTYLVRPDDYMIFDLDEENGCYRGWLRNEITNSNGIRPEAMSHFTFENLTKNYGFFPIEESELEFYENKCDEHYKFLSWQSKTGGTYEEYLSQLKS